MNIRYLFKGLEVDDRTRDYIEKRIAKLEKFLDKDKEREYEVEIDLDKKGKFRVEIMVKTPYRLYRAEETSESIEGSVDVAVDEMENQINRDKDRLKEIRKRGGRSIKKKMVVDEKARF